MLEKILIFLFGEKFYYIGILQYSVGEYENFRKEKEAEIIVKPLSLVGKRLWGWGCPPTNLSKEAESIFEKHIKPILVSNEQIQECLTFISTQLSESENWNDYKYRWHFNAILNFKGTKQQLKVVEELLENIAKTV